MEYKVIHEKKKEHENGNYYLGSFDTIYQLIYDKDYGYALLDVVKGELASDFNEDIDSLVKYTTIEEMKLLEQVSEATFKVV